MQKNSQNIEFLVRKILSVFGVVFTVGGRRGVFERLPSGPSGRKTKRG